ncbi:MAG: hypothetical protein V1766_14975 [Pseudomonadota bacterium]
MTPYVGIVFDRHEEFGLDGFLTFVHVDRHGPSLHHGIVVDAVDPKEIRLQEMVKSLQPGASLQG